MNLNINLKMKDSFKNSASVSKVTSIVDTCSLVIDHARRAQTTTTGHLTKSAVWPGFLTSLQKCGQDQKIRLD